MKGPDIIRYPIQIAAPSPRRKPFRKCASDSSKWKSVMRGQTQTDITNFRYKLMRWSQKSSLWRNYERKRIHVRAFYLRRIGQSCHMRPTFGERVSPHQSVCRNVDAFARWCWGVSTEIRVWVCKHFVLEPWRKMMRWGQLSFWLKQVSSYRGQY